MQFIYKKVLRVVLIILIFGGGVLGMMYARSRTIQALVTSSEKIRIVATIYPLAEFAKNVGGELVYVTTITPPGVEPHEYEPAPQDVAKLYEADLVLINGNGVDAWADKLVDDLRSKQITVIRISEEKGIASVSGDPHFWLDPVLAKQAVLRIAESLALDSRYSTQFDEQKDAYIARLSTLDQAYRDGLARCERREIVTAHNAFRYLAARYNLQNTYILGLSPEEDPSLQKMAEVADLARRKGVTTIFFETLVSPKLAQTIATEIGAQTATLNPIEGITNEELLAGKDYLRLMQENLEQLRSALACI